MNRFITPLVLIATLALCAACARDRAFEKTPLPVSVQPVASVAATSGEQAALATRYSAVLAPREQVSLAFKVPGYVETVTPSARDKGSRVTKGQVLARLRDADYKARLAQAKSTLDEARATLALARRDQERNSKLINGQVISRSEFERTQERLEVAQAKAAKAAAALEQAEINLRDATLASPMDAMVVRRDVEHGTLVNQGSVAFVLVDLTSVKAVFGLPDQDIARVSLGNTLGIVCDALAGREFTGVVTAISPSADPKSRTFEVEVTIANPDLSLKDGMIATVRRASVGQRASLAAIPLHALARPASGSDFVVHVLAEKNGKTVAQLRTVSVAGVAGDMVTILSGLTPGEQVITRGSTLATDGQEVRVIK
jgi:multidrug efflux system membrane fusion protein